MNLSNAQKEVLSEEQIAFFNTLSENDRKFFSATFSPQDLPGVLDKKAEKVNAANKTKTNRASMLKSVKERAADMSSGETSLEETLGTAAMVLGGGAAVALGITDNKAAYRGVTPSNLMVPLAKEFDDDVTEVTFLKEKEVLIATVSFEKPSGNIPALKIVITPIDDGVQIEVNEMTTAGTVERVASAADQLLSAIDVGNDLFNGAYGSDMGEALSDALKIGGNLVRDIADHNLVKRAWEAMIDVAKSLEESFMDDLIEDQAEEFKKRQVWDNYYNCPVCAVAFAAEDTSCRICNTGRPPEPSFPDPRMELEEDYGVE